MVRYLATFLILLMPIGVGLQASDPTDPGSTSTNPGSTKSRHDDILTIFDCDFGEEWDNNFDLWPDHWLRVGGVRYPQFIKAEIEKVANDAAGGKEISALTVHLDGGAFATYSEPVKASQYYSYKMEVDVRTSGVTKDHAQVALQFLDEQKNVIRSILSKRIGDTKGKWIRVRLGPVKPNSRKIAWIRVRLATVPSDPPDLAGKIGFANVWVGRLSRLDLKTNQASNGTGIGIFNLGKKITIDCMASGFKSKKPAVKFVLKDVDGQVIDSKEVQLRIRELGKANQQLGNAKCDFSPPKAGFYRVYASLDKEESLRCRGQTSLAVVEPFHWNSESEFGWSLPHGRGPYSVEQLTKLLLRLNSGWVEYPLWYGESTSEEEIDQLLRFVERLSMSEVKLVGLLCDPPPEVRKRFGDPPSLSAAEVFTADPELWYPSLETVMVRLGPRIPYWLLGSHEDESFVDQDHLQVCLAEIIETINQTGVDIMLGIPWCWVAAEPVWNRKDKGMPAFLTLTADPPMTASELQEYSQVFALRAKKNQKLAETSSRPRVLERLSSTQTAYSTRPTASNEPLRLPYRVVLQPLDPEFYSPKVRAGDLVQRMLAAKQGGASAILMSDPFAKGSGMISQDGSPGILLMPWRTTTLTFGGSHYLGSLQLPNGSQNRIFSRGADVAMAVWNELPCEERLYLGDKVRIIDIWGRSQKPKMDGDKHIIPVSSTPVFVTGLNQMVTMIRMSVEFENKEFPAVLNREYGNQLVFKNIFSGGVTGEVHLKMPKEWEVAPKDIAIQLVKNEKLAEPLSIKVPFIALAGKNPVRIDFEVGNRKLYRFSAYRTLQVGSDDISMNFFPEFDKEGNLTIIQRFVNQTDNTVSFQCQLSVPGRQWSESQIVGVGRGAYEAMHTFPDARNLIGETVRVRAVENNGLRTLNYQFIIE